MSEKELIRTSFGVITSVHSDEDGSLYIKNNDGNEVKMSNRNQKWFRQIPIVKKKCLQYKGKKVDILTSQTTAPWEPIKYFCDVVLIERVI